MSRAQFEPAARASALKYGVDPDIYVRQITQESGWNPSISSPAGAQGIAQFMPATARGMGVDPLDPIAALDAGARLMSQHLDMFGGDYAKALAAYNAGAGAVQKHGGVPPFAETRQYVATILGTSGAGGGVNDRQTSGATGGTPPSWDTPDGPSGPVTRNFPDGTLRALRPGASGTQPGDWTVIGPSDNAAPAMPEIIHDAKGEAYRFQTTLNGQPIFARVPLLDDPTRASTFVPPMTPYQQAQLDSAAASRGQSSQEFWASLGQRERQFYAEQEFNAGQSEADRAFTGGQNEANRALTVSENAQDRAQTTQENAAARAQQQKQLDETIRANRVDAAQADANLQFLRDKHAVETEAGRVREARETQAQLWNQERDIDEINFQYDQLSMEAQQFNAQESRAVEMENQRRTEATAERRRALAESIGITAQDAGSRGKLTAQLLANPGLGDLDAALAGGDDFFTDESLVPLTDLLGQRADAAKAPNFLKFNPVTAAERPTIAPPRLAAPPPPVAAAPTAPAVPGAPSATDQAVWKTILSEGGVPEWARTAIGAPNTPGAGAPAAPPTADFTTPDQAVKWAKENGISGFSDGGIADGMYLGDEEGSELHIPLGPGLALVVPHDQVRNFLRQSGKQKGKPKSGTAPVAADIAGMADGGVFSSGTIFGNAGIQDQTQTRNFLAEALKRALSGTPWQQQGRAPTPVEVSAPNTDPIVQQLGSSLSSLGTGTPADLFLRRARALAPRGITESVGGARRSA